ncbi:MAG: cobalt transporter CbiM [Proteobacteria bacterium]|nr:cobalt transporter CbiM [Desulfobacula sp.]MBU3952005.1 cobalt transporter CbiM [Pseudomonadota bacterium]MBU4133374.1 cobalt transporter CbiM [Pseudomonadota bacterium]
MHISEGILSGQVLAAGAAITIVGTAMGLKKIDYDQMVHVAILASAFFVASLIHVNIGPVSVHLILNGVVGLLLGMAAFPAIVTALVLQSLFFQYGGLTALGANAVVMAVPAVLVHFLFLPLLGKSPRLTFVGGFLAGFVSIGLSSLLMALALWFTNEDFLKTCIAIISAHVPVMVIEGIITGFCVSFLLKVYPEIIPLRKSR